MNENGTPILIHYYGKMSLHLAAIMRHVQRVTEWITLLGSLQRQASLQLVAKYIMHVIYWQGRPLLCMSA